MSKTKLGWDEAKEIADVLTETENPDEDYSITEIALADKYGISLEDFHEIMNGIFQMIDFGISPLTQTSFVGISKGNQWLAKKEVDQQFIHAIIEWATQGEDITKPGTGFKREITVNSNKTIDAYSKTATTPCNCDNDECESNLIIGRNCQNCINKL